MNLTTVITAPIGTSTVDRLRFNTATALDGSLRIQHSTGVSNYTATSAINIDALEVKFPGATYTVADGATYAANLAVTGQTTLENFRATELVATTKIVGNTLDARNPSTDTLVVTAKNVLLDCDVEITGSLDTLATQTINIQDKTITIGAIDADENGIVDTTDATRDGSGLVIPGVPVNMPAGTNAELYEHSIKWILRGGDFQADGSDVAPQHKPLWELNGGSLSITGVDHVERPAQFFFAPSFEGGEATLGLYYTVGDGRVKLVHNFSADSFPL